MKQLPLILIAVFALSACDFVDYYRSRDNDAPNGPNKIFLDLLDDKRYLSVDEVTDRIIQQDPAMMLVDVRDHEDYDKFTLPGAVNAPLAQLLDENVQQMLDCSRYNLTFFSNDDVLAERAWMIQRRLGCQNVYVVKGGLNEWMDKIMSPVAPPESADSEAFDLYSFRKAARKYFIGRSEAMDAEAYVAPAVAAPVKKTIPVQPKKKVVEEEEGC